MTTYARDGSLYSGGDVVISLSHYQGTSRTAMMVDLYNVQTPTGKFLNLCIADLVIEAGIHGPLWKIPIKKISAWISKHSLVYHTFIYSDYNNIIISVLHDELKLARGEDQVLMSSATKNFHKGCRTESHTESENDNRSN